MATKLCARKKSYLFLSVKGIDKAKSDWNMKSQIENQESEI
jgi:hypothetical protein